MSEQTEWILIRLLLRSSLIRIYTVCHSFYIFWRHYFNVKLNCFILRTTTVAGLGVPIFRVITVVSLKISSKCFDVMCYVIMILGLYHILKILCENSCEFNRQSAVLKTLNTEDILENSLGWWCSVL